MEGRRPLTNNIGYPRIGVQRELKTATESYWAKNLSLDDLLEVGKKIREANWKIQKQCGIDMIPSNDFSYYDHVLDHTLTFGAIPPRYLALEKSDNILNLYFTMARGFQSDGVDVMAMEMTKWFDTNYHYIVPEFIKDQEFSLKSEKIINEFKEAKQLGIITKPVLIGPISFLLLGKEKGPRFNRIDLIDKLLPVYEQILNKLASEGAEWIQFDEPFLNLDIDDKIRDTYKKVYKYLNEKSQGIKFLISTYFESLRENITLAVNLPIQALHIDLIRGESQFESVLKTAPSHLIISLGIIDGRNIWKNNYEKSLKFIKQAIDLIGIERVWISPSCSLLHCPYDLDCEKGEHISNEIKSWLSFAKQKLLELNDLACLIQGIDDLLIHKHFEENKTSIDNRKTSKLIHNIEVENLVNSISENFLKRKSEFKIRKKIQKQFFNLPLFPTTTIGSFPQTKEIRGYRAKFNSKKISKEEYDKFLSNEIEKTIRFQEEINLDILVHGEFERNDMVEYFGAQLNGYIFTKKGWVQSFGTRCVKPPILYGDVSRQNEMSVKWLSYAQSLTKKRVKGMLTGPITMLQWSFVRDDQPRSETATQMALAILNEVKDLEKSDIKIIQIDEPAFREGLPLRKEDQNKYLEWAVRAFKIASSNVEDDTQIHTHMCYSEFNDIIQYIAKMDADVIAIESSRSNMELLDAFADFHYPNDIGPGVYDIHSPRVPSKFEIVKLLKKAMLVIDKDQLWVNPDCGLKTRSWTEIKVALKEMVDAATLLRQDYAVSAPF